jgi:flavin reductase ActVB
MPDRLVGPQAFREAMSRLPSPVTVVTTLDPAGQPCGMTASAVCSLSLEPPLVLVAVARSASTYRALTTAPGFVVNILGNAHREVASRFATHGVDRFAGGEFALRPGDGIPYLPDALARVGCRTHDRVGQGDHTLLIGAVTDVELGVGEPLVWQQRAFHTLVRE